MKTFLFGAVVGFIGGIISVYGIQGLKAMLQKKAKSVEDQAGQKIQDIGKSL